MLFLAVCADKPGALPTRLATREVHLAWLASLGDSLKLAGPYLNDEATEPRGSMLVIEAADLAEAKATYAQDPYVAAGLFASVEVKPWRWVFGAPKA